MNAYQVELSWRKGKSRHGRSTVYAHGDTSQQAGEAVCENFKRQKMTVTEFLSFRSIGKAFRTYEQQPCVNGIL